MVARVRGVRFVKTRTEGVEWAYAPERGDEEKAQILKILRGQVLQVIIDRFDIQSF